MGTLIKKVVTRSMPADAKIVTRKRVRVAQWKDRKGKNRTAELTDGCDGTLRIKTEAATKTAKASLGMDHGNKLLTLGFGGADAMVLHRRRSLM